MLIVISKQPIRVIIRGVRAFFMDLMVCFFVINTIHRQVQALIKAKIWFVDTCADNIHINHIMVATNPKLNVNLKRWFHVPDVGSHWRLLGRTIIMVMGVARPRPIHVKIAVPMARDWKRAMDRAAPKNGAVQGVAIMVVNTPYQNMLSIFRYLFWMLSRALGA